MIDGEKGSIEDTGLKLRNSIVVADEESVPAVDNPAHMKELNERFMGAVKSEDESVGEPDNVIGQREMHQRLRKVTLANHSGEIAGKSGEIIPFRSRIEKA